MGEQLLLDRLALDAQIGIVLQARDERRDELVEADPQRVLRIGAHLAGQPHDARDHLLGRVASGDAVEADEPQVLHFGRDDLGDRDLDRLVVEHAGELLQHAVEELLVPVVGGQHVEQLSREPGDVDLFEPGDHRRAEERAHALVVEDAEAVAQRRSQVGRDLLGVPRLGQPPREAAGGIEALELLQHLIVAEEIGADEGRQVLADPILVARDDRGVRDRQPERMPEQRDDREPVGDRADHRRLCERGDVAPRRVAVVQQRGDDVDRSGSRQQAERDRLHALQIANSHARHLLEPFDRVGVSAQPRAHRRAAPVRSAQAETESRCSR